MVQKLTINVQFLRHNQVNPQKKTRKQEKDKVNCLGFFCVFFLCVCVCVCFFYSDIKNVCSVSGFEATDLQLFCFSVANELHIVQRHPVPLA